MAGKYTILAVDDSLLICQLIENVLKKEDILFYKSHTGEEALDILKTVKPDLLLLDIVLPDMDGYEVLQEARNIRGCDASVIFITSKDSQGDVVKGFSMGACDYIRKPFQPEEMKSRILAHLEAKKQKDKLLNINETLLADMEKLNLIAYTDQLTGVYNRHFATEKLAHSLKQNRGSIILAMADIDDFKKINDTYGHQMGDYVLAIISHIMEGLCDRQSVIRWGGEEFLIILQETDEEKGREILEQIRREVEIRPFVYDNTKFFCTITLGMTKYNKNRELKDNVADADKALYLGKTTGKNKLVSFNDMIEKNLE